MPYVHVGQRRTLAYRFTRGLGRTRRRLKRNLMRASIVFAVVGFVLAATNWPL